MSSTTPAQSRPQPRASARWRTWLIMGISLFWLIFGSYLIYNWTNAWPAVSGLEQLVAPSAALMPAIAPLTTAQIPVRWGDSLEPQLFDESIMASGGALAVIGQRVQYTPDAAIDINQLIVNTYRPATTAWEFLRVQPGGFDLQNGEQSSELALTYQSPAANQQRTVCIQKTADQCPVAYIWARYGQYLVRVRLDGEDQPLAESTISAIFEQIDRHITQKLQALD